MSDNPTTNAGSPPGFAAPPKPRQRRAVRTKGIGSIFLRGQTWWIQYSVRGMRYRESAHSGNRADAVRLLKSRLAMIGAGKLIGPEVFDTTMADLREILLSDYRASRPRSVAFAATAFKRLGTFFHHATKAANIRRDTLSAYIAHSEKRGMKPATTVFDLAVLRRACNLAVESDRMASAPKFPRPAPFDNRRTGFVEPADLASIVRHLPPEVQPIVTVAYWTGWRTKSELLSRRVADVDLVAGTLRLDAGHSKNHEGRIFPIGDFPALQQVLEEVIATTRELERRTGRIILWLFHRDGERIRDFRKAWQSACRAAGRPGLYVHDLRRSAVRNLVRSGVPESIAMKITGHKSRNIFLRYDIVSEADLRAAGRKLAEYHAAVCHNLAQPTAATAENR